MTITKIWNHPSPTSVLQSFQTILLSVCSGNILVRLRINLFVPLLSKMPVCESRDLSSLLASFRGWIQ